MPGSDTFQFLERALAPFDPGDAREGLRHAIGRSEVGWEAVVAAASRHLVTPTLYRSLGDKALLDVLPAEVRSYLEAVHALNGERNRRLADQLLEIVAVLNRAGIEPVLLKGIGYLFADLYRDPAARVIGDIDLLVTGDELPAAVAALAAQGYREAGPEDYSFAAHHHHTPLVCDHGVAAVELHDETVAPPFTPLLPAARLHRGARPVTTGGRRFHLPAPQDQLVHNIVHTQLVDRHYWLAQVPLRPLSDLARLRMAGDAQVDWREILTTFDRIGLGSACRVWLMMLERMFGQALPSGVQPDIGARIACWRIRTQQRHPWLMAAGEWYGYHRAILAKLRAGRATRRQVLARLLHPRGYRRYFRTLQRHMGRGL
jgi:hypothetical protein